MNSPFPKSSSTPGQGRIVARLLPDGITSGLAAIAYQYPLKLITPSRPPETRRALVFLLDWVTQGRAARGEDWSFVRWVGRNEVWTVGDDNGGDGGGGERLLVRDAVILDNRRDYPQMKPLREAMHAMGVVGTLVLRG